jgi:hypothetical protein
VEVAEQVEHLCARERWPHRELAGHVRDASVQLDGVRPRIEVQHGRGAGGRMQQSQQQTQRGGLPGTVGPEVAEHLTAVQLEVEVIDGHHVAERLGEPLGAQHRVDGHPGNVLGSSGR